MSVTQRLNSNFSEQIRLRGNRYFVDGAVQIQGRSDTIVSARVFGSSEYHVMLKFQDTFNLAIDCDCPHFCYDEENCKHIWATILDAERSGFLSAFGVSNKPIYTVASYDEEMAAFSAPTLNESDGRNWQHLVTGLKHSSKKAGTGLDPYQSGNELHYFLDLSKSNTEGLVCLRVCTRERRKDGRLGKPKVIKIDRHLMGAQSEEDNGILEMLMGAQSGLTSSTYVSRFYERQDEAVFVIPHSMQAKVLKSICATQRCTLQISEDEQVRLHWDDSGDWVFELELEPDLNDQFQLSGYFCRNQTSMNIDQPLLLVPGGLLFVENTVCVFEDHNAFAWIGLLRQQGNLLVPRDQLSDFVAALHETTLPPTHFPQEIQLEKKVVQPGKWIFLSLPAEGHHLIVEVKFKYEDELVPASSTQVKFLVRERRVTFDRDYVLEKDAYLELYALGLMEPVTGALQERENLNLTVHKKHLPGLIPLLLKRNWHVEAEGKIYRQSSSSNVNVRSATDWFEVTGEVKFGQQNASMPQLLRSLKQGKNTVTLDDGSVGILPEAWLKKYANIISWGDVQKDQVVFDRQQVLLLDVLLADQADVDIDAEFERYRQQLAAFDGIKPLDPPQGFKGVLRDYQAEGLGWLVFLNELGFGGCLADDMGLGKTVQVLALLALEKSKSKCKPSLIVVPRSLVFNWVLEVGKFSPDLSVLEFTEADRGEASEHFNSYDIILTTYGILRRDIHSLKDFEFNYVILDEAQAIKNSASMASKAVRILKADNRLVVTGTPIENHIDDLWSLFDFLNPGMLGKLHAYKALQRIGHEDIRSREAVAKALRPFILRRTKNQVAKDLPEKTELTIFCEMKPPQKKLYEELKLHYQASLLKKTDAEGLSRSKIQILEALLRLRQAACHPALIDDARRDEASAKLDCLWETMTEVLEEGHKVLVFSQFTSFLSILRQQLDADKTPYLYLDGRTRNRQKQVDLFQNDDNFQLFLISLKAGGVGLNLTAADYVFLLDPWWNPAVEAQAIDRAHRIGQTRNVFAYRLICRGTVEEKVMKLQRNKTKLAESIITADNSLVKEMSQDDLAFLLS